MPQVLAAKERPIIFSGEMVKAILAERKTQTRCVVKYWRFKGGPRREIYHSGDIGSLEMSHLLSSCPYGIVGDRLWVREGWARQENVVCGGYDSQTAQTLGEPPHALSLGVKRPVVFRADYPKAWEKWRSPLHLPRTGSRLLLEITEIRVERVQSISSRDALAEGVDACSGSDFPDPVGAYQALWDTIYAKDDHGWEANPWVWCLSFRVLELKR